ncbi:MAG TPA: lipopolysaccharide kinase InaA family protein [Gemmatimonadaceae bacterium]|nr:lipopolysaccharide kinase InaA family protein [Gemmatimonadaceae bacterium]
MCAPHVADGVRTVLAGGTLYRYAQSHVHARALSGRGVVFAVPLPGDVERIVVRHNWHGGLFAALTRDWFRLPTRAPHELLVSEQLRALHVPTPAMLGYVIYHSVAGLVRVDVFSREVPDSFDLAEVLRAPNPADVVQAWSATRQLVRALAAAGARHHDLNVKNILLQRTNGSGFAAYALDVDRVQFDDDRDAVNEANIARLMRSARKWQQELAAPISDSELRDLEALLRRPQPAPTTAS